MLAFLRGTVNNKGKGYVILDVRDVGYRVFVPEAYRIELSIGQALEFYVYHQVREDGMSLYGFKGLDQLEFFELLLTVSGIGPKSAFAVLSIASVDDLKETIAAGDPSLLTKVSGVGRKTAERVVLELRTKVALLPGTRGAGGMRSNEEEIDALVALGYTLQQARDALRQVDGRVTGSSERIKAALKHIGR